MGHGFEIDMIGINKIPLRPVQSLDRFLGRMTHICRLTADYIMFAKRLIPDWCDIDALFGGFDYRG